MSLGRVICITGIDTDIGKTIVTGLLGKYLKERGNRVITQKLCQTGCKGISEDILTHRKIMGMELEEADRNGLTCPYVFSEPCSPHLAARLEDEVIDLDNITAATAELREKYQYVLLEGVGGLMVPLTIDCMLADYFKEFDYSHLLVSSDRLGSINHTLSAIEIMKNRGLDLRGIIYNRFQSTSEKISEDSRNVLRIYLHKYGYKDSMVDVGRYNETTRSALQKNADFGKIINDIEEVKKVSSWQVKKMCLSCKHYRLKDEMSGICRVEKSDKSNYPMKLNEDICDKWKDCGQQYYIRTGWIKGQKDSGNSTNTNTNKH